MYYRLNETGEIVQTCDSFVEGMEYTDEDIVVSYDEQRMLFKHEAETAEYKEAEKAYREQTETDELRSKRTLLLSAFDKWEKAVLRGRETEDKAVMDWYQALLDLDRTAFEENNIPERIRYYL